MLHSRFQNDKVPTLKLNELQIRNRDLVEEKIEQGSYEFESIDCAICDSNGFETLAQKDRYGLNMTTVICQNCGLVQTNPRMTQASYNSFYNEEYRPLYVGKDKPTTLFFQRQYERGQVMYQFLKDNNALNFDKAQPFVLEIGCGAGGILQFFKEQGFKVKGIDLGASYVDYGVKEKGLDLETGFLKDLKLDEQPDLVVYSHVVEHLLDPSEEMSLVRKVLSPRGYLYIEVPGIRNLKKPYKHDLLRYLQNAHTYHFTKVSLDNLLQRNGYDLVVSTEFVKGIYKPAQIELNRSFKNDFAETMGYLTKLEEERSAFPFYPYSKSPYWIKTGLKNVVLSTLESIGVRKYIRRFRLMLSGK